MRKRCETDIFYCHTHLTSRRDSDTLSSYKHIITEHGRALWPSFCGKCGAGIGSTLERFPELQVINIGTLDKPEEIE